jgi:hypothetical protein
MRIQVIIGILLICFGLFALTFQGITFFTEERVVDVGPLEVDVKKPRTIVFHPILGIVAVAAGVALLFAGRKQSAV